MFHGRWLSTRSPVLAAAALASSLQQLATLQLGFGCMFLINFLVSWIILAVNRNSNTTATKSTMPKRKSDTPNSKHLSLYQKAYKGGGPKDLHFAVFQDVARLTGAQKVLYPGCHRHLTAALVFPKVTFVDYDKKVGPIYSPDDTAVQNYVEANKVYEEPHEYEFHCHDVENDLSCIIDHDYDLLVSLSAGLLAGPCTKYVSRGGYLLVNDSHSDARSVFANQRNEWRLFAYWDIEQGKFTTQPTDMERCFQVVHDRKLGKTKPITKEQVRESVAVGAVRKRSFTVLLEPMFFLFKKIKK